MNRLWILGAVLGLSLVGCGSSKYAGKYEGNQPRPTAPEHMRKTAALIELEIKGDGRFLYQRLGMPWEGSWVEKNGKLELIVDSAMGKEVIPGSALTPGAIILTPLPDGSMQLSDTYVTRVEKVILKPVRK